MLKKYQADSTVYLQKSTSKYGYEIEDIIKYL